MWLASRRATFLYGKKAGRRRLDKVIQNYNVKKSESPIRSSPLLFIAYLPLSSTSCRRPKKNFLWRSFIMTRTGLSWFKDAPRNTIMSR